MSIEAVAIALHHSRSRGTAKLVLIGIANHDGDGGSFPKIATLAKYAGVHPRRVVNALAQLGELGEIIVETNAGGTTKVPEHMKPNLYHFVLACPTECDRTKNHRIPGEHLGRSYRGQFDADRVKDPERIERGHKARNTYLDGVDNIRNTVIPPSAKNSTSAENSTPPSAENSTPPSAENSTTKNHQVEPSREPGLVPSLTSGNAAVDKPRKPYTGITAEQIARNAAGAAKARAALKGQTP